MLFLNSQRDFQETMALAIQGRRPRLEWGYDALYEQWSKENAEVLYRWSAEERTQSFVDFVKVKVEEKTLNLLKPLKADEPTEDEIARLNAARRGALLLVSKNEGESFDTVMSLDDIRAAKKEEVLNWRVLSSTLRSTLEDPQGIIEEQELLNIVSNLTDQSFQVEEANIENHVIKVKTHHPKMGVQTITVESSASWKVELVYTFVSKSGEKHVVESQLPEFYGEVMVEEWESQKVSLQSVVIHEHMVAEQTKNGEEEQVVKSALASYIPAKLWEAESERNRKLAAIAALQKLNASDQEKRKNPIGDIKMVREQIQPTKKDLVRENQNINLHPLSDVQASKKTFAARKEREKGELMREKKRIQERVDAAREEQFEAIQSEMKKREKKREENKKKEAVRRKNAGRGAALASAAFSGMLATSSWMSFLEIIK